jgi:hypothetical protein
VVGGNGNETIYWIPGRRGRRAAATPVPPDGSVGVHRDTELMFLPARRAVGHSVYFGPAGGGGVLPLLVELEGALANIARPATTAGMLQANTEYEWRVDTHTADGTVQRGETWALATGAALSCAIAPHPPRPPVPPGPAQCADAELEYCPGQGGKGGKVGEPCYNCVCANAQALEKAGCWTKGGAGGRHAFILSFCGSN